jgi:hypothetical protein
MLMYSDVVAFLIHTRIQFPSFLPLVFGTKMEDYVLGFPHVFIETSVIPRKCILQFTT